MRVRWEQLLSISLSSGAEVGVTCDTLREVSEHSIVCSWLLLEVTEERLVAMRHDGRNH